MPGVRSDGDVSSLDGGTGGADCGTSAPPNVGGLALSSIGGGPTGRGGGGADVAGGVD